MNEFELRTNVHVVPTALRVIRTTVETSYISHLENILFLINEGRVWIFEK